MTRTIVSLDEEDKAWLDRKAAEAGVSMTALVRRAIRQMRRRDGDSFEKVLEATRGKWPRGDGLMYQRRIRKEWR